MNIEQTANLRAAHTVFIGPYLVLLCQLAEGDVLKAFRAGAANLKLALSFERGPLLLQRLRAGAGADVFLQLMQQGNGLGEGYA